MLGLLVAGDLDSLGEKRFGPCPIHKLLAMHNPGLSDPWILLHVRKRWITMKYDASTTNLVFSDDIPVSASQRTWAWCFGTCSAIRESTDLKRILAFRIESCQCNSTIESCQRWLWSCQMWPHRLLAPPSSLVWCQREGVLFLDDLLRDERLEFGDKQTHCASSNAKMDCDCMLTASE